MKSLLNSAIIAAAVVLISTAANGCRSTPVAGAPAIPDTARGENTSNGQYEADRERTEGGSRAFVSPDEPLPIDPAVVVGRLENGLSYYIRKNGRPENIAALELVVDAGSVVEDDDERGMAHFVEHMAFNGTVHFKKNEIVDYFESIGIRFGPEVNAYTSFDETVYRLEVPIDNEEAVVKAFRILADWAHLVCFEEGDVDRERGIIVEEQRERSGASMRIMEKHYPVLFSGAKYARRLPIGTLSIIKRTSAAKLGAFYGKWYRPELIAVIAVGDFDVHPEILLLPRRAHGTACGLSFPYSYIKKADRKADVPPHEASAMPGMEGQPAVEQVE